MKIIFIPRKTLLSISLVLLLVLISIVYTNYFSRGTLSIFLNNEKSMPICSVDIPDKRVSITFDCAWGDQYTQDILDLLKRYNIKTTFFLTGSWVEKYPTLLKKIDEAGHEIGNHSTSHVKMTKLSKEEIKEEIMNTETRMKQIINKNSKLFRVPYGDYNDSVILTAQKLSYRVIQWDVDSMDWTGENTQEIINRVISKTGSGSIVLFHNDIENTVKALPTIIESLRKEQYKFEKVSELIMKDNYYIDSTGRQKTLK